MLYITPSRGRPGNIAELIEAWDATRTMAHLWVCVDDDDPTLDGYGAIDYPDWATLYVGPRLRLGATLNRYALEAIGNTEVIGFMGDDHRPRSQAWDAEIMNSAAAAGSAVIYGNDLVQRGALATAVAMTADVVATLGYFVPPGMTHLFLDNAWGDIGRTLGNFIYRDDVVIEHMHPITGKVAWDEGYVEVNAKPMWDADEKAYRSWLAEEGPYAGWRERLRALKDWKRA